MYGQLDWGGRTMISVWAVRLGWEDSDLYEQIDWGWGTLASIRAADSGIQALRFSLVKNKWP